MKRIQLKRSTVLTAALYLLLYALVAALVISAVRYRGPGPKRGNIVAVNSVEVSVDGAPWQPVSLPLELENLPARTPVLVQAEIRPEYDDCVFIKTTGTPAEVLLDGRTVCTLGQPGTYPAFFADPPTEMRLVESRGSGERMALQVRYASPASRSALTIHPFLVGSSKEIIFDFAGALGGTMILALVQIIVGCAMLLVSLCLIPITSQGQMFFWLGLFSKFSGIWFLCRNDFSVLCFLNDSLLYILSFIGLVSFLVPLLHFLCMVVAFQDKRPVVLLEALTGAAAITAMVLQLAGLVSISAIQQVFCGAIPAILVVVLILVVREAAVCKNPYAARYLPPFGILTVAALLELADNRLHLTAAVPFLFQVGVFLFLLYISILAGLGVRDSINLKRKAEQLEKEKNILAIQMEDQREWGLILARSEREMSRQRHDLRHHLRVLQELSEENTPLRDYLTGLTGQIPRDRVRYCENVVVNAIVSHYAARCEQEGIAMTTHLVIPETKVQTADSDLCVIVSNLLENAVEACGHMQEGEKYIRLTSAMQQDLLSIVMENSFNGEVQKIGGRFRSSKRDDYGIGLSSVQCLAAAAHGDTDFHAEGKKFISSVYLHLPEL